MTVVAVALAAAVGAVVRHLVATSTKEARTGVLLVNVAGSLALGLLVGARIDGRLSATGLLVLGTGFCGALTTWSAFAHGVATEASERRWPEAAAHVAVSLALGLAAAALGLALA